MCIFITVALPAGADLATLADVAARHRRCLTPIDNPSVREHLQPGDHYCLTRPGHCDAVRP